MTETSHQDIRRLLKTFGIQADEAVRTYLASQPGKKPLRLRLVLEDLTDYGGEPPAEVLHVVIEGEVRG